MNLEQVDPFSPSFQQNPYPYYDAMRQASPAWHHPVLDQYFVTRFDLASAVLKNHTVFSSAYGSNANEPPAPHLREKVEAIRREGWVRPPTLLTVDPPEHTRYRSTVAKAFNARAISELRDEVQRIVDDEFARTIDLRAISFKKEVADTIPVRVILHALALPTDAQRRVKQWSDDTTAGIGARLSDDRTLEATRGVVELQHFMNDQLTQRIGCPQSDVLSALVEAELPAREGSATRKLTIEEAMGILQALIGAGNETTTKLFSQMMLYISDHPDAWSRLRLDPGLAANIVDESLRLSSPTQGLFRVATVDTELDGVPIPAGSKLFVGFAAANRDPQQFPDPNAFIPDRANARSHLAFGAGPHYCLGAPLSKLESTVLLERMVVWWSDFRITNRETLEFEPSYVLRGLTELNIEFEPA